MSIKTYAALLRGINVAGQKKIRMKDLAQLLEAAGLQNVVTYIQSGNVVFRSSAKAEALAGVIEAAIRQQYGFEVAVIIRSIPDLQTMLTQNPFADAGVDESLLYYTLLKEEPDAELVRQTAGISFAPEQFAIRGKQVFIYCVNGYGHTKMSNAFFERKLRAAATTRNLNTIRELIRLGTVE